MVLSVSRRTDIPNYYSQWFLNRIQEGHLYVRNPINPRQISKINLSSDLVDCIVFWTKNPTPMLGKLNQLREYHFYFQFTLTGYGKDIEPYLPHKREQMLDVFLQLSSEIGKEKVIWRYDPILITDKYSWKYHIKAFQEIASALNGYTDKVVISFIDFYKKTIRNMHGITTKNPSHSEFSMFALDLSNIARANGMKIASCAEDMNLSSFGIEHNSCIDKELIEKLIGCKMNAKKDQNQRDSCKCIESIDIGTYNTCINGCKYCYANDSVKRVKTTSDLYNPLSPLLCGSITSEDRITERPVRSLKVKKGEISTDNSPD